MGPLHAPRGLSIIALVLALTGCASMAPQYVRPASPVAATFRDAPAGEAAAKPVALLDWPEVFVDARLRAVIGRALKNNRDLRVALLNIEKARAQYGIQEAELLPVVQASASRTAARTSGVSSSSGSSEVGHTVSAQVGFSSWELDLFGRLRSLSNEARESWLATAETQRSTRLSLVAEVAGDWLTVGADKERLALARKTLESQSQTLKLTVAKHALGVTSGLDLSQVQSSVESARADVAAYETSLAQAINALELVVGASVPDELLPDADTGGTAVHLAPLPANLSSDILLQRPDVLSAEHTLKAANANIGAARAALFPTISLTSSTGRSSSQLSSLFAAGTRTWSFIPSVTVPIFDAGALRAELNVAKIEKDISVAQYEKTIQTAFGEVADALATRARIGTQIGAQAALVASSQRSADLSLALWRHGAGSYLDALDAQRTLYAAQQTLITLRLQDAINRATLHKVLGGDADANAGV